MSDELVTLKLTVTKATKDKLARLTEEARLPDESATLEAILDFLPKVSRRVFLQRSEMRCPKCKTKVAWCPSGTWDGWFCFECEPTPESHSCHRCSSEDED